MLFSFSQQGLSAVIIAIVLLILISIQFTLNQILKELREIRKRSAFRDESREEKEIYYE